MAVSEHGFKWRIVSFSGSTAGQYKSLLLSYLPNSLLTHLSALQGLGGRLRRIPIVFVFSLDMG